MEKKVGSSYEAVSGNILLFYMFDIGNDIKVDMIKDRSMLTSFDVRLSPFFKPYHAPLSFKIQDRDEISDVGTCLFRKLYTFGAISFCYKVPFLTTFEGLKRNIIDIKKIFDEIAAEDARFVYDRILTAISEPNFYNLSNDYFAVQVNPLKDAVMTADEFKDEYGNKIASLLRLEIQQLSEYQMSDILSATMGYYGKDFMVIDGEAAFIYDDEYFEALEFFESVNIERLELQYFDQLLDYRLRDFYKEEGYKVPWLAYIPLLSQRIDLPVSRLAKLKVDISVVTERLENSVKHSGDTYYSDFYALLVDRFLLKEWRESINRKLNIVNDLYTVYQDRLDTIRSEMMELIIIILIALELFR